METLGFWRCVGDGRTRISFLNFQLLQNNSRVLKNGREPTHTHTHITQSNTCVVHARTQFGVDWKIKCRSVSNLFTYLINMQWLLFKMWLNVAHTQTHNLVHVIPRGRRRRRRWRQLANCSTMTHTRALNTLRDGIAFCAHKCLTLSIRRDFAIVYVASTQRQRDLRMFVRCDCETMRKWQLNAGRYCNTNGIRYQEDCESGEIVVKLTRSRLCEICTIIAYSLEILSRIMKV